MSSPFGRAQDKLREAQSRHLVAGSECLPIVVRPLGCARGDKDAACFLQASGRNDNGRCNDSDIHLQIGIALCLQGSEERACNLRVNRHNGGCGPWAAWSGRGTTGREAWGPKPSWGIARV